MLDKASAFAFDSEACTRVAFLLEHEEKVRSRPRPKEAETPHRPSLKRRVGARFQVFNKKIDHIHMRTLRLDEKSALHKFVSYLSEGRRGATRLVEF